MTEKDWMKLMKSYECFIGIDPGTKTGIATWIPAQEKKTGQGFIHVATTTITEAIELVDIYKKQYGSKLYVVVEDARKRRFFRGENMVAKAQGAGSVKRDCTIWEEFLDRKGIDFTMKTPINTKIDSNWFKHQTGWKQRTSNHARDAAMLVYKMR